MNNTTTPPDRAVLMELGAKLTQAQRRVLVGAHETLFGDTRITSARMDPRVRVNLQRKCLTQSYDVRRDTLTPLGLAVREALQQGGSDGRDC